MKDHRQPTRGRRPECSRTARCQTCRREFTYPRSQGERRYCSLKCYNEPRQADAWGTTHCGACSKEFGFLKSSHDRRYCSLKCAGKANVKNIPRFKPTRFVLPCRQCGNIFETTPGEKRAGFCSPSCAQRWRSAHKKGRAPRGYGRKYSRPKHLAPLTRRDYECRQCGKEFFLIAGNHKERFTCSRSCWAKYVAAQHTADAHPNWRGGHTHYYGPSWHSQRLKARRRDRVCQDCGRGPSELGRALDVHHRRRFMDFGLARHEEANHLDNLICYCRPCHHRREWLDNNPRSS